MYYAESKELNMSKLVITVLIAIILLSYRPAQTSECTCPDVDLGMQIVENHIDCTKLLADIDSTEFKEMQLVYSLVDSALRKARIPESREELSGILVTAFHAKCTLSTLYTREEI